MVPQVAIIRAGGVPLLLGIVRKCTHELETLIQTLGPVPKVWGVPRLTAVFASSVATQMSPRSSWGRKRHGKAANWVGEVQHSKTDRLLQQAVSALEELARYHDDNPPAITSVRGVGIGGHRSGTGDAAGVAVLFSALKWCSVLAEQYGSRRHELIQLSILQCFTNLSTDFEARSQLRASVGLLRQVMQSAEDALDAVAGIGDAGVAEERHFARAVYMQTYKLIEYLEQNR